MSAAFSPPRPVSALLPERGAAPSAEALDRERGRGYVRVDDVPFV